MTEKMEALRKHYRDVRRRVSEFVDRLGDELPRGDARLLDEVIEALDAVPALTAELQQPAAQTSAPVPALEIDMHALVSHYLFLRVGAEEIIREFQNKPITQEDEQVKIGRVATHAAMLEVHPKAAESGARAMKSIEPLAPMLFKESIEASLQRFRTMYQQQADQAAMEVRADFRRATGQKTPKPPARA